MQNQKLPFLKNLNSFLFKLFILSLLISTYNCGGVKVLNSWTSDNAETLKSKKILVIARAQKKKNKEDFENEIAKQFRSRKFDATESHKQFPELKTNDSLSKEEIKDIINMFKKQGYNAIVVSSVTGVENLSKTLVSGGHESGATLSTYANMYPIGFYGFYSSPLPTPTFKGVYEEVEMQTFTQKVYVLETVAYNLDLPEEDQLVARVTSKIDNVETAGNLAKNYAKAIFNGVKNR
jgi:hypothetical protein